MIIDKVREFIRTCPLVKGKRINVDFLGADVGEYTIDSIPSTPIIKHYVDGGSLRQFVFVFASKEYYSSDFLQNIENAGFYEKLADWFEEQNEKEDFIDLGEGKKAIKIEATSSGYLFDEEPDKGRYQCQCRLVYYQEAKKGA